MNDFYSPTFEPNSNTRQHDFPQVGVAHVTLAHMLMLLRGIVADFGHDYNPDDGSGSGCMYAKVENGVLLPVCIVGQVFHRIGLLGLLANVTAGYNYGACQTNSFFESLSSVVTFDPLAQRLLSVAQVKQDTGDTWGEALKEAVNDAKRMHMEQDTTLAMLDGFTL